MGEESFTMKEMVKEILLDVKELNTKIDRIDREGSIGTKAVLLDHESRVRSLESWSFRIKGAVGVLALAVSGTISYVVVHFS